MKASTTWNFGNFTVTAQADITPEAMVQKLLNYGLTQLLQRSPATEAEFTLAEALGMTASWEPAKTEGKRPKRPQGFQRNSLPFTADNAEKLKIGFGTKVKLDDGSYLPFEITSVVENGGSGEDPMIGARRFVSNLLDTDAEKLVTLLSIFDDSITVDSPIEEMVKIAHAQGWGQRKGSRQNVG